MPVIKYGNTHKWHTVGTRIPPEDLKRLEEKYPTRGQVSEVIRALIQMHLDGKIPVELEFTMTQKVT